MFLIEYCDMVTAFIDRDGAFSINIERSFESYSLLYEIVVIESCYHLIEKNLRILQDNINENWVVTWIKRIVLNSHDNQSYFKSIDWTHLIFIVYCKVKLKRNKWKKMLGLLRNDLNVLIIVSVSHHHDDNYNNNDNY